MIHLKLVSTMMCIPPRARGVKRWLLTTAWLAVTSLGCAGGTQSPGQPAPQQPKPAQQAALATPADAQAVTEVETEPPALRDPQQDDRTERERLYRVTPSGLEVRIEGVTFTPKATAVRYRGGWGLRIEMQAESNDGKAHYFLTPTTGVFACGGNVERTAGGEPEPFNDAREGGTEQTLLPDVPLDAARDWPAGFNLAPLGRGQPSPQLRRV
jgi:hypothetical protein